MRTSPPAEEIRLRAAAIIVQRRRILLGRAVQDAFWALPGGMLEAGELSRAALVRELGEELGEVPVRIGRLMFVLENRFACGRHRFHEVGLIYGVELAADPWQLGEREFPSPEHGLRLRWVALSALPEVDLRPRLLRDRLAAGLPHASEHLEIDELQELAGAPDQAR